MTNQNDPLRLRNLLIAEAQKRIQTTDLPAMVADPKSLDGQIKDVPLVRLKRPSESPK